MTHSLQATPNEWYLRGIRHDRRCVQAHSNQMVLAGKNILLGISGGIAAYKTPLLVRQLVQAGAQVQTVLTRAAAEFVTPTTLAALSGRPPRMETFDVEAEAAMGHIELARWADALLIAPATAHILARLATGLADDLLTTLALATPAPLFLAPAMNQQMWAHRSVQRNLAELTAAGARIIGPDSGEQACGDVGEGRMSEPESILQRITEHFAPQRLAGRRVVVTAGPTREAIDPVRYISNHSSGKQGYAIAEAARDAGAEVVLISGPTALPTPRGVDFVAVESAREMHNASMHAAPASDVFIGVAAVADYRPAEQHDRKIKRETTGDLRIDMQMNPDIIRSIAQSEPRPQVVVGFAAETNDALQHARDKRVRKGLDLIVVNDVSQPGIGFNSDDNAATIISADAEVTLHKQGKDALARALISAVADLLDGQLAPTNPESAPQ